MPLSGLQKEQNCSSKGSKKRIKNGSKNAPQVFPTGLWVSIGKDVYNSGKLCVNVDNGEKWGGLSTGLWITLKGEKARKIKGFWPF